jgi:hypothetical protein
MLSDEIRTRAANGSSASHRDTDMSDMNVRSDAVDVEQIMRQIRARIREKRGADYTEAELQQLASVKLEKFLDPRGIRSDLVEQFRRQHAESPAPPHYEFGEHTLFETHRGPLQAIRKLLRPLLKLFFNPDRITAALHLQSTINAQAEQRLRRQEERGLLYYELVHNLTLEITRLGIEVHNLKMRVESLSSRLDFDERRGRSLEAVVQYRPDALNRSAQSQPAPASRESSETPSPGAPPRADTPGENGSGDRRRRRRRRRRRPGQTMAEGEAWKSGAGPEAHERSAVAGADAQGDADDTDSSDDQ